LQQQQQPCVAPRLNSASDSRARGSPASGLRSCSRSGCYCCCR